MNWLFDLGDGPAPVTVPHVWHPDAVDVRWEGPAVYRAALSGERVLRFHGVSYRAEVLFDGRPAFVHDGIWDAFDVPVPSDAREIEVRVTKNGGPTFPVRDVASGFLPYVFHTFGGIFREVEADPTTPLDPPSPGWSGEVPYLVGVLTWGWYPETASPHPDEAEIRREVRLAKERGFNLIKFCLWLPPHRYLDVLREEGMLGWIELPLWAPSSDPARLAAIAEELDRIVLQYRRHTDVVPVWTVGCELSHGVPHEYRRRLVERVVALTGAPLVKDNSGGAEMYGGDLREYGTFDDFHPYCDLPFYPLVLDSLLGGDKPVLLGEFDDHDVHRDLPALREAAPYWASPDPARNDPGVRWQYDLPQVLATSPFASDQARSDRLMASTRAKALFVREFVHDAVRARPGIRGYVVTGWRDTPISSSGYLDDAGLPRFTSEECRRHNEPGPLLLPWRRPPWVHGGNRPGWLDPFHAFEDGVFARVRPWPRSPTDESPGSPTPVARGSGQELMDSVVSPGATRVGDPGDSSVGDRGHGPLPLRVGGREWTIRVLPKPPLAATVVADPAGLLDGTPFEPGGPTLAVGRDVGARVTILTDEGTVPKPFWREAGYEFAPEFPFADDWPALLAISPDRVLAPGIEGEWLVRRIDVRTYAEDALLIRRPDGSLITTLRPFGGLGVQPVGVHRNPVGWNLLAWLLRN